MRGSSDLVEWDCVGRAFLFVRRGLEFDDFSEVVGWGGKHESMNALRVSMGAFDMGPAAPAARPQRAVWNPGSSWPWYLGCQSRRTCCSFV